MDDRYRTLWTDAEIHAAKAMRDKGMKYADIGKAFGRTESAAYKAIARAYGVDQINRHAEYFDGPAIGITQECKRLEKDAKLGSQVLAVAINDLINRMDPMHVAVALGKRLVREPGTERIHKTSSIIRLEGVEALNRIAA